MAQIVTGSFGLISYHESELLLFEKGLAGFENESRFLPIQQPALEPFVFLQSALSPDLCFPALPAGAVCSGFQLECEAEELLALGVRSGGAVDETLCLAIVTLNEDGPPTANLLAPVVIHVRSRRAAQIISTSSKYSHRHPLTGDSETCS